MTEPRRILLVEDDPRLVLFLEDRLRREGFDVTAALTGRGAIQALDDRWPDLVILDLILPDLPGEDVAAAIKERADLPIIVLSAVNETESKVELIERYAEDYVTKPFEYAELRARIQRVLWRLQERLPAQELVLGPDLTLVLRRRLAIVGGRPVRLSPTETRLLSILAANHGRTVSTEQLLSRVWSQADGADPSYVWVTMRRLRQKIELDPDHPRYLHTERSEGYRLGPPSSGAE
jgi:DNA-binding response OmpR family regulator